MATYTSNYGWTKPSGSDNVDISVLNNNLDDQDSTIHDAFLNMAPPFSESSTYAVDDIVLYTTGLYKCHTAVVTPGSWTGSANWQVYKLSEGGSGGGGTSNYNDLTNKPSINGVTLSGNKTTQDLNISYDDLQNKPSIPSAQIQSDWNQTDSSKLDFIKNKPPLGTAAAKNVPSTGDAGSGEVVMGNDSRLSDSRPASDVSSWAKQATKPTYTASEVGAIPSTDKGANGGVATLGNDGIVPSSQLPAMFDGDYNSLTNKPTLGTAAAKDVPSAGNASLTEVVMGSDSRLSDDRNAKDVYPWAKSATKPTYTATEVGAIPSTDKGANGGVAELDSNGKVPSSQLPSYVDDVLSYASQSAFPATGETGKIYIAEDTNKTYRWSGSAYAEISASLALGETSSTAYRGDRGKTAYDHSQTTGNPHGTTASDVGLGNVPNVSTNDQTPTFTKASTRNNIASGEKLSVILGKVQKFFNDLKTVAFTGSFSDLSNKPENANTFQGTIAEWNQLTTAEKKAYDHASIPDSLDGNVTFPASKVIMTGGENVEDALAGSKLTDITGWEENTSYPLGTALPTGTWIWIAHKILPAGLYYISCMANLSTGTTTTVGLMQRIRDLTHHKVLITDSITAQQRCFPSYCMVALTETTDIYFDVYVAGSTSIYAREFHAIKLF